MDAIGKLIILLCTSLCLFLLFVLLKFFHKLWWTPIRIQRFMRAQGVKGPPYRFLYGNTKEILSMRKKSLSKTVEISHHTFTRIQPYVYLWMKTYGNNYLQWYGPKPQLVLTEPEMIKEVMNNKAGVYPKEIKQKFSRKLLGDGILTTTVLEKWAKLRKVSNHVFQGESLRGMIPAMVGSVEMMLERWRAFEGKEVEVYKEFRLLTSEIISRTAFGSSYMEGERIFVQLMKLGEIITKNAFKVRNPLISKFLKSSDDIESETLEKGIRDAVVRMIRNREEVVMHGETDSFGDDFLGSLIKANHDPDQNKRLSLDEMIDECKSFYVAGQETTNSLLAWMMLLLAVHTDWQEEARKEVLQIFGQSAPNQDRISKLKTISMIIHETLRLYTPVAGFLRNVKREVRLGELLLPANLNVYVSSLALHYDPQIWGEDVHLFKPERFSEGVAKATNNNITAFIPFGIGPRNCVGFNFATIEAKIALSMILQRYTFTLSPAYVHSPCQNITITPQYGVKVTLKAL